MRGFFCTEKEEKPTPNPFLAWGAPRGVRVRFLCEGCAQQGSAFPTDTMDFSGMSLIKLKKEEMETQVWP